MLTKELYEQIEIGDVVEIDWNLHDIKNGLGVEFDDVELWTFEGYTKCKYLGNEWCKKNCGCKGQMIFRYDNNLKTKCLSYTQESESVCPVKRIIKNNKIILEESLFDI